MTEVQVQKRFQLDFRQTTVYHQRHQLFSLEMFLTYHPQTLSPLTDNMTDCKWNGFMGMCYVLLSTDCE